MKTVLGIDAAWTEKNPSGVALVCCSEGSWKLLRAAGSYPEFLATSGKAAGLQTEAPDFQGLLTECESLCGFPVDVIAVDMPLSHQPIVQRRCADNRVSEAYGARHAGTHTPNVTRPGTVSTTMRSQLATAGYPLCTQGSVLKGLVEVYPHPALIELTGEKKRLPYKCSKVGKYWRTLSVPERKTRLLEVWTRILEALEAELSGVSQHLLLPAADMPSREWKRFEDALDAVVCAWVGICVLEGRAAPHGNGDAAIWVPKPWPEALSTR